VKGFRFRFGFGRGRGGASAAAAPTLVWLGSTLGGAPALPGAPAGAVHLNASETSDVTRGGVTMRVLGSVTASDNSGFASVPFIQFANNFQGVRFAIPAGNWEFAIIGSAAFGGINGTLVIRDVSAAVDRQTIVRVSSAGALLMPTSGATEYTVSGTAVAGATGALVYVPVTVSDGGGGNGVVQVYANPAINIALIALKRV
jgi:hypothetical protein